MLISKMKANLCITNSYKTRSNVTADLHVGTVYINSHSLVPADQPPNEFNMCPLAPE
jgi:hypothetical protein